MYNLFDIVTTGFALFAMLFGAGNLIFPPILGYELGANWSTASIAFILTGVGIPLMGMIAASNAGDSLDGFGKKVSPIFAKIYSVALILAIGPLLALPRTGATAYEVTFYHAGFTSETLKYIYLGLYFGIALLFSLKSSKVVDRIGKILTPILIAVLFIMLVKGTLFNSFSVVNTTQSSWNFQTSFKKGFIEGYQTLDALAAIAFSSVILKAIKNGRNLDKKQEFSFLLKSSLIATFGLAIVYAGLTYIGATFGNFELVSGAEKTDLLVKISVTLLGNIGYVILAICVAGACLTTAIGLIVTVGEYFSNLLNISYQKLVIVTTLFGFLLSITGVNKIVTVSVPVLFCLYPVTIALIFLHFMCIKNENVFKGVAFVTILFGLYEALSFLGIYIPDFFREIYNMMPLNNLGLAWVIPTLTIGFIFGMKKN